LCHQRRQALLGIDAGWYAGAVTARRGGDGNIAAYHVAVCRVRITGNLGVYRRISACGIGRRMQPARVWLSAYGGAGVS
jgi:hypothetical protein